MEPTGCRLLATWLLATWSLLVVGSLLPRVLILVILGHTKLKLIGQWISHTLFLGGGGGANKFVKKNSHPCWFALEAFF